MGLSTLLAVFTELVVAESVVVIKKLLQMQPEKHSDIIKHMAKLTDNIQVRYSWTAANVRPGKVLEKKKVVRHAVFNVPLMFWVTSPCMTSRRSAQPFSFWLTCYQVPMARASILWLIGEYCEHVPKIAPDVLRKMAKSFTNEEDIVKLQIINLSAKLYLTNSKQVWTARF